MADIVMPRLSDTMEEGTILRWLKGDGEQLARGEELVEIETDKATMVYESDQAGVLQILAEEGQTLPVGSVIALVGDLVAASPAEGSQAPTGSVPPGASAGTAGSVGGAAPDGPPSASRAAPPAPPRESGVGAQSGRAGAGAPGERVKASPLARRMAREQGLDLSALAGSGPGGRIVRADLGARGTPGGATGGPHAAGAAGPPSSDASQPGQVSAPGSASPATLEGVATAKGETTTVELTRTQGAIARRMAESKATIPDFAVEVEVDMEACVRLREELKHMSGREAPTYNDMVVKACALALREHPHVNGSYRDGRLQLHSRVNVGVAVAAERSLVVPTIFDADAKSLGEIARETRGLAERVRDGTITPPELGGGTFTVSNLGMFGVRSFQPIINPPQAAILSVGALERRASVRDGELAVAATMALTLVCDHRILYGADAARFAARVRDLLQAPAALTL